MSAMKLMRIAAAVLALSVGAASAQTASPPATGTTAAPEAGANSFTEAQAKDRIEKAGFREVSSLRKDDQGVWRAMAKQGDKQVNVSLDFRGNVTAQ